MARRLRLSAGLVFSLVVLILSQSGSVKAVPDASTFASDGRLGPARNYFNTDWHQYYIHSDSGQFYRQYSNFPWEELPSPPKRIVSQARGPEILLLDFSDASIDPNVKVWVLGSRAVAFLSQTNITIGGLINPRASGQDIANGACMYCGNIPYAAGGSGGVSPEGNFISGAWGTPPPGSPVSSGGVGGSGAAYVFNSTTPHGWDLITAGGGGGGGGAVIGSQGNNGMALYGSSGAILPGGAGGAAVSADVFQGGGGGGQGGYSRAWTWASGGFGSRGGGAVMFVTPGNLTVTGEVHVDGDNGVISTYDAGAGGGGGGGQLRFHAGGTYLNNGQVTARGGAGGRNIDKHTFPGSHGGAGGGGRIVISATAVLGGGIADTGGGEVITAAANLTFNGSGVFSTQLGPLTVQPAPETTVTFDNALGGGVTTVLGPQVAPVSTNTPPVGAGYTAVSYFDVSSSVPFNGSANICFAASSINDAATFARARVLHYENAAWSDRTILSPNTPAPNFGLRTICARVSSFSPFAVVLLDAPPPTQLWNADYTFEYDGARESGDVVADTVRSDWHDVWRFSINADPNGSLGSPTITVTPSPSLPGTLVPFAQGLQPGFPPYVWTGPGLSPGQAMFAGTSSNIVPAPYQLGYSASRSLSGGRGVAGNAANDTRTFSVTVTPVDPTLTEMGVTLQFAGFMPASPVSASNVACAAPDGFVQDMSSPGNPMWYYRVGGGSTPIASNTPHTVTCSLTLDNSSAFAATYTPALTITGQRTSPSSSATANFSEITSNPNGDPSDPLGTVRFEVTPSTSGAVVATGVRFARTMHFDGANALVSLPSTTTVTVSNSSNLTYGGQQSVNIAVTGPGATAPGGSLSVSVDGGPTVQLPVNVNGAQSFSLGSLPAGPHTVTAQYLGDTSYLGSSGSVTFNVNRATPNVQIQSLSGPVTYPAAPTFTVLVSAPGGGTQAPSGIVNYSIDGGPAQSATLAVNPNNSTQGIVSINAGTLNATGHTLNVSYLGDNNFNPAGAQPFNFSVNRASTITTVSGPGSLALGASGVYTVTVTDGAAIPVGSVTLNDNGVPVGTASLDLTGQATFTVTGSVPTSPATHFLQAQFTGGVNFNNSSGSMQLSVAKPTPAITLTASSSSVTVGAPVTFTATVSGTAGTPMGNVSFRDNGNLFGGGPSLVGGVATVTTSALTLGSHTITATYNGSPIYNSVMSQPVTVTVNPAVILPPPFSQIYPMPEGACICTPLLMNLAGNTAGTQNWFFKANSSLALTVTAQSVSSTGAGTVRARVFDSAGTQIAPDIVASFPSGTAAGTGVSQTGSFATTQDAVYRVEIATPSSIGQAHYLLKFDGAQEAGTNTPTSPSFEEVHANGQPAIWFANAAAHEQLELAFLTSQPPAVPGSTTLAVLRVIDTTNPGVPVPLVDLGGAPLGTTATLTSATTINQSFRIDPAYAAAAATPRIYALVILETNGHFKLSRANGADLGLYMSWVTSQEGTINLNVQTGNLPLGVPAIPVQISLTDTLTGIVRGGSLDASSITFGADAARYRVDVTVPAGYVATPASFEIDVLCEEPLDVPIVITAITQTAVNAPSIIQGQDGIVTVNVGSVAGVVPGNVLLSVDGGTPLSAPLSGGTAVFTIPGLTAGDHSLAASYAGVGNFLASNTTGTIHVEAPVATATTVTSNNNPSLAGTGVTFTATVSPNGATGTVQFKVDGVNFGGPVAVVAGQASSASTTTLALGPHIITAVYSGDSTHLGSTGAMNQLVYGIPANGAFVIGDEEALVGAQVTFWSSQWTQNNDLSGTDANNAFKGFANNVTSATWTTSTGNSSNPPSTIPAYMIVLVTSTSTKSGATISGNIVGRVIVHTNAGYAANPGHAGTGTIVAVLP
jgi:hypothetical protein